MPPTRSSGSTLRSELVRFTGEVTDVRITPETTYTRYSTGRYGTRAWANTKQVGAMTVRVSGQPITCLIDMYTRFIGVMAGNTVTIWGRVRKWDADSDVPDSVDVERLAVDETGEVHPQGFGASAGWLLVIPVLFGFMFMIFFLVFFLGPFGMGSFTFFPFSFIWIFFVFFVVIAIIPIAMRGAHWRKRFSSLQLERYVEVPSYSRVASMEVGKASVAPVEHVCSSCGAAISDSGAAYCSNCGASLQEETTATKAAAKKCMVCNLPIRKSEATVFCPRCGNPAHRTHMLEWLHTHDYCPVCRKHLDEQNF